MAKKRTPIRTPVRTWEDAVDRIQAEAPPDLDVYLHARSSLRRDRHGLHTSESYDLTCYHERLKVGDEYYKIVATTPRELYARYVSEFLPAVERAFAPPPSSEIRVLPGPRTLRLAHTGASNP